MNPRLFSGRPAARPSRRCGAGWTVCVLWILAATWVHGADRRTARRLFADPPREYASAPLWVWNDLLTEDQVRGTMRDMAGQDVKQVFVHPRPGLMTPYLGEEWLHLWKVALSEAARLDMNVWIYDENSYPSGFAGGWVPELMPESRGMGLALKDVAEVPAWADDILTVHRVSGGAVEDVTDAVKAGRAVTGGGPFVVGRIVRSGNSGWHGDRCYVNLLTRGVTEKFLEVTLGAYDGAIADHYGKRVPGVFTDEPNIRPAGGFPWCPDLPEEFQRRWGYSLIATLPSLAREVGDWRRVRHNYLSTLNDLFIERWAKPYYEACERRGLEFTGHYWDHEWPHCLGVPDNMAMAAWQHRPGIDTLMNQYAENTHAQFGNVRFCREVLSVANQLGRQRTLVEVYGAGGWDLRFEDMKRIADWLFVLGINTMDEHLSYVTLRGARKRDHPQSFSYHEPWWPAYHVHARYLSRLCAALSQGEQVNRVLVLEPTTTAWMYQGHEAKLSEVGDSFFRLLMELEAAQVEYDLGCEDILAREGGIGQDPGLRSSWASTAALKVGRRQYPVVIVPPHTETLSARTCSLLNDLLVAGGQVLSLGPPPERVDGKPEPEVFASPTARRQWRVVPSGGALRDQLRELAARNDVVIERAAEDPGILFHHRRELEDGQLLFLVNTSLKHPSRGIVRARMGAVERWDPYTGKVESYPYRPTVPGVVTEFDLPPSGSLLLFLSTKPGQPEEAPRQVAQAQAAAGPMGIRRLGPNVLTLDYLDIRVGQESRQQVYFYVANRFLWQQHGVQRNPWDNAVQFRDELIRRDFPRGQGFEVSYRFRIEEQVPKDLAIVLERPDLYTVTCNGREVRSAIRRRETPVPAAATRAPVPGGDTVEFEDWWLDRAFGRIPIGSLVVVGENVVTLKASALSAWHELEPAYVLGDFALRSVDRGWVIRPPEAPLQVASRPGGLTQRNNPDGTMWLSGGIGFGGGIEDRAPWVVLDLGRPTTLTTLRIWNYSEGHVRDLTGRGVARLRVLAGPQPQVSPALDAREVGTFDLRRGDPRGATPDECRLSAPVTARFVKLEVLRNWHGTEYPASGEPADNGFAGLGEVQCLDAEGRPIEGVRIAARSSELAGHRRLAAHLVDGSGLDAATGLGWDEQGHPFYAEGVLYSQRFTVPDRSGEFVVSMPEWHGAVARVTVNGRETGWITAPPWECDVSSAVRRGENQVEVAIVGTLRNTLGPHHGGHALGSAWPGMFQQGPETGPPPGRSYSTVGYGLFAPYSLVRRVPE